MIGCDIRGACRLIFGSPMDFNLPSGCHGVRRVLDRCERASQAWSERDHPSGSGGKAEIMRGTESGVAQQAGPGKSPDEKDSV
jgi:hypothetical protein